VIGIKLLGFLHCPVDQIQSLHVPFLARQDLRKGGRCVWESFPELVSKPR
jgi:hypothetical protein